MAQDLASPERTYTVKQMADLSGVSVRTLHYYEEVGLLNPERTPSNYRRYRAKDVQRLQQVLLFRACGMDLASIKDALERPGFSAHTALEHHLSVLHGRQRDLEQLIANVCKTLASMEGLCDMDDKERFEGLKQQAIEQNEALYGQEVRARFGDAAMDGANERMAALTEQEWNSKEALGQAILDQLGTAMATGDETGAEARSLCEMHEQWLKLQWAPGAYSREMHAGLAEGYVADPRFTAYYDDAVGTGATQFLRDALVAYCSGE